MQRIHHKNKEKQTDTNQILKGTNPQKYILLYFASPKPCPLAHQYMSLHHLEQEEQASPTPTQKGLTPSKIH